MKKAEQSGITISHEAAFFIAQRIRSNVRELGRPEACYCECKLTGRPFDIELIKESLKDLLALQDSRFRLITS